MAQPLMQQRRGRGTHTFKAKLKGVKTSYHSYVLTKKDTIKGQVIDLFKDTGRAAILAKVKFENYDEQIYVAAEGLTTGQWIQSGNKASVSVGNILSLNDLPEGCPIFNIETRPGDGGKMVKTSGGYALLLTKDEKYAQVKLPSNKIKKFLLNCRATVGNVSCGERTEKPFVKAGNKFHSMVAKHKKYPINRGVAMNANAHPFGGSQHHAGKGKSSARSAVPGRKVGAIASKRTGRKKK